MVWLYELPLTASPLDAGVASDFGPAQGIIGTLVRPGTGVGSLPLEGEIAKSWEWDSVNQTVQFHLNPDLTFQDGTRIRAEHFVKTAEWIKHEMGPFRKNLGPDWIAWLDSEYKTSSVPTELQVKFPAQGVIQNPSLFLGLIFGNVLTGAIHPTNLAALQAGVAITQGWISSGPYRIRKWNPKEVILISRNDFSIGMSGGIYRILKYQSAPVINPAADFLQAIATEGPLSPEHTVQAQPLQLFSFWICRSWKEPHSVCADESTRAALGLALNSAQPVTNAQLLAGKKVRYRIPVGSEAFREGIKKRIQEQVSRAGGAPEEISFFFKNSDAADLEIQFVSVPKTFGEGYASMLSRLSSRLHHATEEPHLNGLVMSFDQSIQWKGESVASPLEVFKKVFLTPDMTDKKINF